MSKLFKLSSIAATAMALSAFNANAAVEIYNNNEGMTVSTDAFINVFYTNSSSEKTFADGSQTESDQSRVRMGFLPNYLGFNFSNQVDDIKLGARASFWVSINDTDNNRDASPDDLGTGSLIDVRQFYGTISGDFGEILIGKDFGLYNRANILGDELLIGHGQTSDFFGLVDGGNVSFGNISTGYTYPFPKSQITYRSPDMGGFKLAIGIMDPNKLSATSDEDTPRIEGEVMYSHTMDNGSFKLFGSFVTQSSQEPGGQEQDNKGVAYGVNVKFGGVSLTASGFSSDGLGHLAGLDQIVTDDSVESDGHLLQASYTMGDNRFVISSGETEVENTGSVLDATHKNLGLAYFRTIRPGLTFVAEYNRTEVEDSSAFDEENDTIALGAVLTF